MSIPPIVAEYFDAQRREQQSFVQLACIKSTLNDVTVSFTDTMKQAGMRGTQVDEIVSQSDELLDSSEEFHNMTMPAWRRFIRSWIPPSWWWEQCGLTCCRRKRKRRDN